MTEAFVEERRASLERYLNRLAAHPAAARSEVRGARFCCIVPQTHDSSGYSVQQLLSAGAAAARCHCMVSCATKALMSWSACAPPHLPVSY